MDTILSDSTSNIHRRYRHLFTLPARNRTIAYASIISVATTVVSRVALGTSYLELLFYGLLTEVGLLLSIEIDRRVLSRRTRVATYRRLTTVAIVSDSLWLVLSFIGALMLWSSGGTSPLKLLSLVTLGAFFAVAIRALLIGSLFYPHPWQGVPLAFVQPAILILPIIYSPKIFNSQKILLGNPEPFAAVIGGLVAIFAIELYVASINRASKIQNFKPIDLLQAFLNAWAAEDATNLERVLDLVSREGIVKSQLIRLEPQKSVEQEGGEKKKMDALIIVPGPHPGPFYPIGSSNLPFDIFQKLRSPTLVPMVVHSISDHDLNLPSKRQVERYVHSLLSSSNEIESGNLMSSPVVQVEGKARICALSFGSSTALLTITQAPYGMEDFPTEVKTSLETYSSSLGFKNLLLIDSHNSEGEKPDEKECEDAISAARHALDYLKKNSLNQSDFKVGVAHSSELSKVAEKDVGPAGIDLVLFETPSSSFSLVVVDANNSLIGFREKVIEDFEKSTGTKVLEICTSDTHVTAAKTSDAKGYLALGDVSSPLEFAEILKALYSKAKQRLCPGSFTSSIVNSKVKTIGGQVLNEFSGMLDSASSIARNGAEALAVLAIVITAAVALI